MINVYLPFSLLAQPFPIGLRHVSSMHPAIIAVHLALHLHIIQPTVFHIYTVFHPPFLGASNLLLTYIRKRGGSDVLWETRECQ